MAADTPAALERFLSEYPENELAPEAEARLAELHWQQIRTTDDPRDLEQYAERHPDSPHGEALATCLEVLVWEGADTVERCRSYAARYPGGRFAAKVTPRLDDLTWEAAQTIDDSRAYAQAFPRGRYVQEVPARIEDLA